MHKLVPSSESSGCASESDECGEWMSQSGSSDEAVRGTNDHATETKVSAVGLGYYADPYVTVFGGGKKGRLGGRMGMGGGVRPPSRSPLMNRGTYARVLSIRSAVESFLAKVKEAGLGPAQVISLGAGFDTLPFLLAEQREENGLAAYLELDMFEVIAKKVGIMRKNRVLKESIGSSATFRESGVGGSEWYACAAADLRDVESVLATLEPAGLVPERPTLLLSEVALVYMEAEESNALLAALGEWVTGDLHAVVYEQIHPDDPFGQVMVSTIASRGCPLRSIAAYPDEDAQIARFLALGYTQVECADMLTTYNSLFPEEERARVASIEFFDEYEEWNLLLSHYCLLLAHRVGQDSGLGGGWLEMTMSPGPEPSASASASAS